MDLMLTMSERTLYNRAGWNSDEDILFARWLDIEASRGYLTSRGALNSKSDVADCLLRISVRLTNVLGRRITRRYLFEALARMRSKYVNFKEFIGTRGVIYCARRNRVGVTKNYWRFLEEQNEIESMAYCRFRELGEPMFMQLRNIFEVTRCPMSRREMRYHTGVDDFDEGTIINPPSPPR